MSYRKEKSYTYDDMMEAFNAGGSLVRAEWLENEAGRDNCEPDFDEWIDEFTDEKPSNSLMENSINSTNESEKQVVMYLENLCDSIVYMYACNKEPFGLRPQGDNTIIEKDAINLMEIKIGEKVYTFGGITEKFFDEVCEYFSDLEENE